MTGEWSRESWELEVTTLDFELRQDLTSLPSVRNVFVTLRFASVAGVGEVHVSADAIDSVVEQLDAVDPKELINPFNLEGVLEILPAGPARCALDIALHDLAGKIAGLSITKLLGVKDRPAPPTSLTLLAGDADEVVERARLLVDHPVLKMKVGFVGDVDAVGKVRAVYSGTLRVDANAAWEPSEAIARLRELEAFEIELCEQPIPAGNRDGLGEVTSATSIPVFTNRGVSTPADVVAMTGVVDGVCLRLSQTGGIRGMLQAIATARAHGLGVMLGGDLVTGIGATAEAHLAPLVDYLDIDGPLFLREDPFPGVGYDKGRVTVPDLPGLGVNGVSV